MNIYLCVLPLDVPTQGFRSYRSIVVADVLTRRERDAFLIVAVSLYPGVDVPRYSSLISKLCSTSFSSIHDIVGFSLCSLHYILRKLDIVDDAYIYFLQDIGSFEKELERHISRLKETNPELLKSRSLHPLFQYRTDYELSVPPILGVENHMRRVLDSILTKIKRKIRRMTRKKTLVMLVDAQTFNLNMFHEKIANFRKVINDLGRLIAIKIFFEGNIEEEKIKRGKGKKNSEITVAS